MEECACAQRGGEGGAPSEKEVRMRRGRWGGERWKVRMRRAPPLLSTPAGDAVPLRVVLARFGRRFISAAWSIGAVSRELSWSRLSAAGYSREISLSGRGTAEELSRDLEHAERRPHLTSSPFFWGGGGALFP